MKAKIAIAIDKALLSLLDSIVDGSKIQSRSQAIELFLKEGLKSRQIDTAVIVIHKKENIAIFQKIENKPLLEHNLDFLKANGISKIYVIGNGLNLNDYNVIYIEEKYQHGTAAALKLIKNELKTDFILLNGDALNTFDLRAMINMHKKNDNLVTMGLIYSKVPERYGSVLLDGNDIIGFQEKKPRPLSNIIYSGIAIFKSVVFDYFEKSTNSLEKDLFPKLAKPKLMQGYFNYGEYIHLGE